MVQCVDMLGGVQNSDTSTVANFSLYKYWAYFNGSSNLLFYGYKHPQPIYNDECVMGGCVCERMTVSCSLCSGSAVFHAVQF